MLTLEHWEFYCRRYVKNDQEEGDVLMPFNENIPGQVTRYQLQAIELIATLVPKNGNMVEVGSLFGSSSWCWAKSVDPSVTVYCVDPWQANAGVVPLEQRYGIKYGLEQFKLYTSDCPNIVPKQGYSPRDFADWQLPLDLYYEDAVHTNPILENNLNFWTGHLKPAGIICGDDYRPRFLDVREGAHRLAKEFSRELITVEHFWCLLPDDDTLPRVSEVRAQLRDMAEKYRREMTDRGAHAVCHVRRSEDQPEQKSSKAISLDLQIEPKGIIAWPTVAADRPLKLNYKIYTAEDTTAPQFTGSIDTELFQLMPDIARILKISIPLHQLHGRDNILELELRSDKQADQPLLLSKTRL